MAIGDLLHGKSGLLLHGRNGTLLYYDGVKPSINLSIEIAWSDGNDVDIACFWTDKPDMIVGWSWSNKDQTKEDGSYSLTWHGDNISGGPESVDANYSDGKVDLSGLTFEIHCNWFEKGEDHTGGNIIVSAGGKSISLVASDRSGSKALPTDPGAVIRFNRDGSVREIAQW